MAQVHAGAGVHDLRQPDDQAILHQLRGGERGGGRGTKGERYKQARATTRNDYKNSVFRLQQFGATGRERPICPDAQGALNTKTVFTSPDRVVLIPAVTSIGAVALSTSALDSIDGKIETTRVKLDSTRHERHTSAAYETTAAPARRAADYSQSSTACKR